MNRHGIILRPWRREDAQALALIANNRKVAQNLRDYFPSPYTVMDAMQWIETQKDQKPVTHFAIVFDGIIVGNIGCTPKEDIYRKSIEIGYFIGEPFWGKGIATESVKVLVEYIALHFDVVRLYAEVFEHNKESMRVLQKNGFYLEGIRQRSVIKNNALMSDYVWVKLL